MLKYTVLAVCVLLCSLSVNAEARQRHKATGLHPDCNVTMPCVAPYASTPDQARVTRGRYIARQMGFGAAREARPARHSARPHHRTVSRYSAPAPSLTWAATTLVDRARSYMGGIVAPLAAKVSEIQSVCGSRVISGVRHTRIAGTRRMSLHASGKAVDLQGNPSCMYGLLHDWRGGYSVDYASVRHLHLSFDPDGGREMGVRFRHGSHRYARRHHRHARYASAR